MSDPDAPIKFNIANSLQPEPAASNKIRTITPNTQNMIDAIANLVKPAQKAYIPNKKNYKVYSKLYEQYIRLHNLLGIDNEDIMLELKKMKGDL